jgi:hypothetical protein
MSVIKSKYPFLAMMSLLAGGFLAVAVYAFAPTTAIWLGFAVSVGLVVVGLATAATVRARRISIGERIAAATSGGAVALIAGWTIVAPLVFAPATALWLVFASACGYVGLSISALAVREITTERVVHHLDVRERELVDVR